MGSYFGKSWSEVTNQFQSTNAKFCVSYLTLYGTFDFEQYFIKRPSRVAVQRPL